MSATQLIRQLDKSVQAPARLHLKKGAHVVLVTNINVDEGLVNGATGTVVRFTTDEDDEVSPDNIYPVVNFDISEYVPTPNGGMAMQRKTREVVVKYHKFVTMQGDEELACREQVPLNLVSGRHSSPTSEHGTVPVWLMSRPARCVGLLEQTLKVLANLARANQAWAITIHKAQVRLSEANAVEWRTKMAVCSHLRTHQVCMYCVNF